LLINQIYNKEKMCGLTTLLLNTYQYKNQIKKFYLKSVHFITVQHKLSRAFQTDMHNKLHKLNTAQ